MEQLQSVLQEPIPTYHPDSPAYRRLPAEILRENDLLRLIPDGLTSVLDIGARDGHLARAISQKVESVTALDLTCPTFSHPRVTCVQGDATELQFAAKSFDLVFCAEVLEHIPSPALEAACSELSRVAGKFLLIGVPFRQDLRKAQTNCYSCGQINPPWGHVNSFDEERLCALFPSMDVLDVSFVGVGEPGTNAISSALMNFAGNPFGTYLQLEGCISCGKQLINPPPRSMHQKVATKAAVWLDRVQATFERKRGSWMHVLFTARD